MCIRDRYIPGTYVVYVVYIMAYRAVNTIRMYVVYIMAYRAVNTYAYLVHPIRAVAYLAKLVQSQPYLTQLVQSQSMPGTAVPGTRYVVPCILLFILLLSQSRDRRSTARGIARPLSVYVFALS